MAPKSEKAKKAQKVQKAQTTSEKSSPDTPAVVSGQLAKQIANKKKKQRRTERGIVFLRNLPHGFFESQLKDFFKQFGHVTRVRLVRSRRTGGSKGYAYVEFAIPDVAKIAAETMGTHFMFQKIVKATYIPPEEQKYNYFKTSVKLVRNSAGKVRVVSSKIRSINRKFTQYNNWDEKAYGKRTRSSISKLNKLKKKFPDLGIDLDELVVPPKGLKRSDASSALSQSKSSEEQLAEGSEDNETEITGEKEELQPRSLLLKKRRSTDAGVKAMKKSNASKKDTSMDIKDLLGTTLNDDSSDEEFFPLHGMEDEEDDEELTDQDEIESGDEDSESESDECSETRITKVRKNLISAPKSSREDRFEKIIKKKPKLGGIQKTSKKQHKTKKGKGEGKEKLKLAAAKEIIKKEKQILKKVQKKVK